MFKKLFAFGLLFVLVGCKTWDPANMIPSEHPIQPKLVTLETSITDCTNSTVIANDIEPEIFSSEVEKNLDHRKNTYLSIPVSSCLRRDWLGRGELVKAITKRNRGRGSCQTLRVD